MTMSVQQEIQQQIDSGLIQGAVCVSNRDHSVIVSGKQCVHPVEKPMTAESRFDIASVGKLFTASCCALLILNEKLNPDAPFTDYLPEHVLGKACDITVRDLAAHASGFDNSKPYDTPDVDVFRRELFRKRPVRPRQVAFEYSCTNFILLGMIMERITGNDLDTLARKLIWEPLGMKRTRWTAPGDGPDEVEHWFPNHPAGQHNDPVCFKCPFPLGSGSCFSTAGDMLMFAEDILNRRQFPQRYYELLLTCCFEKDGVRRSFGWEMTEKKRPEGLSPHTVFHTGWTGQTICIDPENDFAAIVLTSRTGNHEEARAGRARIIENLYNS